MINVSADISLRMRIEKGAEIEIGVEKEQ